MTTAAVFDPPRPGRGPYALAMATAGATWVLLLIGGTVNPTGSSLACPDWVFVPTCHGQLWPEMTGGVLYEHGHRLWASLVGLLTLGLAFALWRAPTAPPGTRPLALTAIALVALQGTLGGATVLVGLDAWLSTFHLLLGYGFFALTLALVMRLRPPSAASRHGADTGARRLFGVAALAVYLQVALGGALRHLGGGLVCGTDWLGCAGGGLWPDHWLTQLHMTHRLIGFALVPLLVWASVVAWRSHRQAGGSRHLALALAPAALVAVQVALGLITVATARDVTTVALHTAVGALVFASLVVLWLAAGRPRRARA